jgi:ferritin-like metal-binding protein YciE
MNDMMTQKTATPTDLLFDQLRDLYSAEDQLCDALPKLVDLIVNPPLRVAILNHIDETTGHFSELLRIFERHGVPAGSDRCQAMAGLIKGGESHLEGVNNEATRDLMMIAHCLRIEQYKIAAYEISLRLAGRLGFIIEAGVLSELHAQEKQMAAKLLELEPDIFGMAAQANQDVR